MDFDMVHVTSSRELNSQKANADQHTISFPKKFANNFAFSYLEARRCAGKEEDGEKVIIRFSYISHVEREVFVLWQKIAYPDILLTCTLPSTSLMCACEIILDPPGM